MGPPAAAAPALLQAYPALLTRAARWGGKADGFAPFDALAAASTTRPTATRIDDEESHCGRTAADTELGLPTGA